MEQEPDKLKLGRRSWFVKSRLKRLPQDKDTWEVDYFPIPNSKGRRGTVWLGMVLSHAHEYLLAERTVWGSGAS